MKMRSQVGTNSRFLHIIEVYFFFAVLVIKKSFIFFSGIVQQYSWDFKELKRCSILLSRLIQIIAATQKNANYILFSNCTIFVRAKKEKEEKEIFELLKCILTNLH